MEFIDLKAQQGRIREKIENNIRRVLDHGRYINGPEVRELEDYLARFTGAKYALGVSSGTDALLMPLMAHGVGPGDAVFVPAFTFFATAEMVSLVGAVPVFVDIDPLTYNIDPPLLEKAVTKCEKEGALKPRGIIPVDLFGQAADYDEINAIASKRGLFVIEDAAQSFGGSYKGKRNCSLAHTAATSFFPAKPLGCYGDGGMIFTDDRDMYEKLVSIRVHGQGLDKYDNVRIGINGRIDTIQAAILLAKMDIFEQELKARDAVAKRYSEALHGVMRTPMVKADNFSAWAQYSVESGNRDAVRKILAAKDIPTMVYYPKPLPFLHAYRDRNFSPGDFPQSEAASEKIFSLPMHPYLTAREQDTIIETILSAAK